ncbi:MAG TPA: ABC transporter ATP-binding protein [Bryobacteraceae bacterium]|nr:ABC transporter ATP-binding protein [Bryobacteraceae bacterium]
MTDIVIATDLVKRFRNVEVLDGLSLSVPEGSVFGLAGPNGAGKTTTIKILMNILQPSAGRAEVLGVDSRTLGPETLANIGYVSENQELPEWMTVEYLLAYLKPFYPSWDDARARQLVRQFDLPPDRRLRHLSRGMRMKAALASSLAYRPRLLIMDEPFSGLDPLVREDLIDGLLESAGETTILLSSHDLGEIESFATHIGYLDRGRLQFSEEMTALTARFREVEVTVDSPPLLPLDRPWPAHWLRPETAPALVRFVETHFDPERTPEEIRRLFGEVRDISARPMPLRAIFVTLARSISKAA